MMNKNTRTVLGILYRQKISNESEWRLLKEFAENSWLEGPWQIVAFHLLDNHELDST